MARVSATMQGVARLTLYIVAVQGLLLGLVVHRARAGVDRWLHDTASFLAAFHDADHQEAPRTLMLNGAALQLSVGTSRRGVASVLDQAQAQCASVGGGLGRQLHEANASSAAGVEPSDALLDNVLRIDDEAHGVLGCLDVGAQRLHWRELVSRTQRFLSSGDLSALGRLRFVSAARGETRTVFATLWSDDALPIATMFPARGDAPGRDMRDVPRPAQGRRLLSAWEVGQDKSINIYEVAGALDTARTAYVVQLAQAGFSPVGAVTSQTSGFVATSDRRALVVTFTRAETKRTLVTISSLNDATGAISFR